MADIQVFQSVKLSSLGSYFAECVIAGRGSDLDVDLLNSYRMLRIQLLIAVIHNFQSYPDSVRSQFG